MDKESIVQAEAAAGDAIQSGPRALLEDEVRDVSTLLCSLRTYHMCQHNTFLPGYYGRIAQCQYNAGPRTQRNASPSSQRLIHRLIWTVQT